MRNELFLKLYLAILSFALAFTHATLVLHTKTCICGKKEHLLFVSSKMYQNLNLRRS